MPAAFVPCALTRGAAELGDLFQMCNSKKSQALKFFDFQCFPFSVFSINGIGVERFSSADFFEFRRCAAGAGRDFAIKA